MKAIYLDNSATTRICREALDKYIEVSEGCYGNPSSLHRMGLDAEKLLRDAADVILKTVGGVKCQLIFTSSGSEANNLAIIGRATAKERFRGRGKIISTLGEHASVSEPIDKLSRMGYKTVYIPTAGGAIDLERLDRELTEDVILLSSMMVNNETGAVYDLPRVAKMLRARCPEALFHVDATQGYLKIPFSKAGIGADLITLSSHKIEGPKGVGALVVDDKVLKSRGLTALTLGGGQQLGLRSGTENVPGIVAFAEAARIGHEKLSERAAVTESLRDHLIGRLQNDARLTDIRITLPKLHAPHILNITLPSIKSETMLHYLSSMGIYVSSGSACSSNTGHLSSALTAYGHSEAEADSSIRISLSHRNTAEELNRLCDALAEGLTRLARIR